MYSSWSNWRPFVVLFLLSFVHRINQLKHIPDIELIPFVAKTYLTIIDVRVPLELELTIWSPLTSVP